jgi:hypothetical protein
MTNKPMFPKRWNHNELMEDLASHLKAPARMVWLDLQLGPSGSPRPDVFTLAKSLVRPRPTAYEVKISREDFRRDVTACKWSSYLEYAHSVVFAVPTGLIDKREVPEQCGLIVRHENVWRLAKAATINPRPIAQEALLKLIIDGVEREGPAVRQKYWDAYDRQRQFAKKFGAEAARWVADAAGIQERVSAAEERARTIIQHAEQESKRLIENTAKEMPDRWKDLLGVLGLDDAATRWDVVHAIARLKDRTNGGVNAHALGEALVVLARGIAMIERLANHGSEN